MAAPGPIPKRSDERIRRNKEDTEITRIEATGAAEQPDLGFDDPHPIIADLWKSMGDSAQSNYYEPSDWQAARYTLHFADGLLKSSRPSAQMFAGVHSAMTDLLITEGARRRVRMEIDRDKSSAAVVDISDEIKKRMGLSD